MRHKPLPTQTDLLLPLLQSVEAAGGSARPAEVYDDVATRLHLDEETRNATARVGNQNVNVFERHVRWTRQLAVFRGYLQSSQRNLWELTDAGNATLRNARRGTIVTVFEAPNGVLLWANAEDAVASIEAESVDAIVTSPPYPLLRQKDYGNSASCQWLDEMLRNAESWRALLAPTGSLFLNLGPCWTPGQPTQDPYIARLTIAMIDQLGYHLAQELQWHSPSRLPAPVEWVCLRRVRLKQTTETILWFATTPNPKANNRNVLVPYSDSMRKLMARGQKKASRPSGWGISEKFGNDNGGAIASNLIVAPNSSSNDAYRRACRANGENPHPATFPEAIPKFLIELSTSPGDLVADFFAGSATTCKVAHDLGRRFIGVERSYTYLQAALHRFAA